MNEELCDECRKFDKTINGGTVSYDVYVVCNHNQPELRKLCDCERNVNDLMKQKDQAYSERNQLLCVLSKLFQSWLEKHPQRDASWENDWRNIVCIKMDTKIFTWHIHDSEMKYFCHLVLHDTDSWDGSTTQQKYDAIGCLYQKK